MDDPGGVPASSKITVAAILGALPTALLPATDNSVALGSAAKQWSDVFGARLTISGTAIKLGGVAYTFPGAGGGASTFLTDAAGNGTLSWAAVSVANIITQTSAGDGNTAVGSTALDSLTAASGLRNTAVEADAGTALTTGDDNVAIGYQALQAPTTQSHNIAIGSKALGGASYAASANIGIGFQAGDALTSGTANVAIGHNALTDMTTATGSTAVGFLALTADTAGSNTAVGAYSLDASSSGVRNTAVGWTSLSAIISANDSTAVGYNALALDTGGSNTAVGSGALDANTTGTNNVGVGLNALGLQGAGANNNTALGSGAGDAISTGDNNLTLGYDADVPTATSSNQMNVAGLLWSDGASTATGSSVSTGGLGLGGMPTAGTLLSLLTGGTTRTAVTSVGMGFDLTTTSAAHDNGVVTVAIGASARIGIITHTSNSASLTFTNSASLYITGVPVASTNVVFTNPAYSLWIDAGLPRIDSTTANGTVATAMSSLGPVGSNTTIQEWLTIDINGATRYIPCF